MLTCSLIHTIFPDGISRCRHIFPEFPLCISAVICTYGGNEDQLAAPSLKDAQSPGQITDGIRKKIDDDIKLQITEDGMHPVFQCSDIALEKKRLPEVLSSCVPG